MRGGRRIPVVAFFGTKGGVGKTTISRRFAELVTRARSAPRVLLIDCDVYSRGMTALISTESPITCKTVHDYVASQNYSEVEAANVTGLIKGARPGAGELLFIPASERDADKVFDKAAKTEPPKMMAILHGLISKSVEQYGCDCVVIDCTAIIDPYTAAAAMMADRAFVIGQNEPTTFDALKSYPQKIRDFYPEFTTSKMKIIINKVRGWEMLDQRRQIEDIFHAIPFTLDIVDVSEGLTSINEMQIMLFEDHIIQVIEKIFRLDHPELVPDKQELLPPEWGSLVENPERLRQAPRLRSLGFMRLFLPVGLLAAAVGCFLFIGGSAQRHKSERAAQVQELTALLKGEIAKADAAGTSRAEALREALQEAEKIDPGDPESVESGIGFAKRAGLDETPVIKRQSAARENVGIGILAGGILLGSVGLACARSRKNYLAAIHGLRKGGTKWMMGEMKAKQSSRKTFDRLLRMSRKKSL
jgi:MinD-like ATPase involved in chromosome partitioning or flagellar assembly